MSSIRLTAGVSKIAAEFFGPVAPAYLFLAWRDGYPLGMTLVETPYFVLDTPGAGVYRIDVRPVGATHLQQEKSASASIAMETLTMPRADILY